MNSQWVTDESPTKSGLDRKLRITKFADPHARTKGGFRKSLRELAAQLPGRVAARKSALPLLKLATFGSEATPKGSLRSNANMCAIDGIEADYDGERLVMADAAERLRAAGVAALLYTSPSHTRDAPRWRVLCPTSETLEPDERGALVARLNGVLDGVLAPESFTRSQAYYYGSVEGQAAAQVELVEGRAIDLAHDLDAGALDKHGKPWGHPAERERGELDEDDMPTAPDVERITAALAVIPADERETWFRVGMAIHDEFAGDEEGFALWDGWSQGSDKYDDDDQRRVWESFSRSRVGKPVTIATVFALAKKLAPAKPKKRGGLTFYTPGESAKVRPPEYVVKHLIARGDVSCIFGAPGAGKSLFGPHIGYQVALGEDVFGLRTKKGVVFYVAAEDEGGLHQRVAGILARQGDTPDFRLVGGVSDLFSEDAPDLEALAEAVEEQRPALIVIDTLAIAFPGLEENEAKSMGRVISVCRQLASHGAAVVLVHHGTKADGSTPRGHSSLNGALDMSLRIEKGEDGVIRALIGKNKRGTSDRDIAFRIGLEELGEDDDGEPIAAPVVTELHGGNRSTRPRLTAAEDAALSKLMELEADGRVSEDDWRAACVDERKVSGSDDSESRKRAMRRAVQGLARKGMIDTRAGVVTLREVASEEE